MKMAKLPPDTKERIGQSRYATLYTGQQIRNALNMLYSLIVIIRNAPGPIQLNRIGSNPLEHLFGKTQLRCWDVNTMKRLLSGLVDHFLQFQSARFLELVAALKRKTSVGVDCDSWHQSDRSCFTRNPIDIVAFLMVFGVSIHLIYQSPELMSVHGILEEIRLEMFAGSNPIKLHRPIDRNCKQATKILSSNHIFHGILAHRDAIVCWNGNEVCNNHRTWRSTQHLI
jgi:hypothetical protein